MNTQSITFRRMQTHFIFSLGIASLICGTCCAQTKQENVLPSSVAADGAYEKLMSATTYSELEQLAVIWEKELSEQARAKLYFNLWLTLFPESNKGELRHLSQIDSGEDTPHDLGLRAGRAVWAIEQLLQTHFSPISSDATDGQLRDMRNSLSDEFTKQLLEKIRSRIKIMPKPEKLAQAFEPIPVICPEECRLILQVLAMDSDLEVREAVTKSKWFNEKALDIMLEHETNPELREQLESLRLRVFMPPLPKLPKGW